MGHCLTVRMIFTSNLQLRGNEAFWVEPDKDVRDAGGSCQGPGSFSKTWCPPALAAEIRGSWLDLVTSIFSASNFSGVWLSKPPRRAPRARASILRGAGTCVLLVCVCVWGVTEAKVCVFWVDADPGLSCFFTAKSRPEGQMMAAFCVFWFWGFGFSLFLVSVYKRLGFPRKLTHPGGLACEPCGSDQTHSSGAHTKPASLAMV